MGIWGLGIGDWGLGPIPNPQSPIPNPHNRIHVYNNKININRFYEIPNAQIYNLFLTHGTFEKDNNNNNIYFTLKNCSESDHYLFKTYIESKDIIFNPNKRKRHRYEGDNSDSSFVFKCNNPFIIENLKLYIH